MDNKQTAEAFIDLLVDCDNCSKGFWSEARENITIAQLIELGNVVNDYEQLYD